MVSLGITYHALMGSLQMSCLFDRWTFWVLQSAYVYLPKSARAYLLPQSVEIHYFCCGPISVCPQPLTVYRAGAGARPIIV